jgi:hypothetical protein
MNVCGNPKLQLLNLLHYIPPFLTGFVFVYNGGDDDDDDDKIWKIRD